MKNPLLPVYLTALLLLFAPVQTMAEGISKQQAISISQGVSPGRVLSVKQSGSTYRVKTLSTHGDVRIIVIDAKSGKVISGR